MPARSQARSAARLAAVQALYQQRDGSDARWRGCSTSSTSTGSAATSRTKPVWPRPKSPSSTMSCAAWIARREEIDALLAGTARQGLDACAARQDHAADPARRHLRTARPAPTCRSAARSANMSTSPTPSSISARRNSSTACSTQWAKPFAPDPVSSDCCPHGLVNGRSGAASNRFWESFREDSHDCSHAPDSILHVRMRGLARCRRRCHCGRLHRRRAGLSGRLTPFPTATPRNERSCFHRKPARAGDASRGARTDGRRSGAAGRLRDAGPHPRHAGGRHPLPARRRHGGRRLEAGRHQSFRPCGQGRASRSACCWVIMLGPRHGTMRALPRGWQTSLSHYGAPLLGGDTVVGRAAAQLRTDRDRAGDACSGPVPHGREDRAMRSTSPAPWARR